MQIMRRFLTAILLASVCISGIVSCQGSKSAPSDELYSNHKPYTRWWWFSSYIDKGDVRDQLVYLKEHGFGGVEIAWIYPMFLDSTKAHPDFLSPEWAEPVVYAKRVADSLGLGCDFTYGTLWPFCQRDLPDGDQTRTYSDTTKGWKRNTWDMPTPLRTINHLDSNVFYRYAQKMNAGLGEAYKGGKSGLFVDSWEVNTHYIWTDGFGDTFMAEHGYDIEPYLKAETLKDPENSDVMYDYMSTLSKYVMEQFYYPFAENARRVGAFSRAQVGGAPTDLLTAFSLVDVPETEAILYEPGFSRIVASAATLGGKEAVSSETFTCAYGWTGLRYMNGRGHSPHQGEEQIADLKLICDAIFANGTNQIFWHGFAFNKVGTQDNWFYTTCQLSSCDEQNLSGDNITAFNNYMTKISDYMRRGYNYTDIAVYMPVEDGWMSGQYPDEIIKAMHWIGGKYEFRYLETPEVFKGRQPMWINGHFLKQASFSDETLHLDNTSFKSLCVDVEHMDYASLKEIVRLAKDGLPVCLMRAPKEPGMVKHIDYNALVDELYSMDNVSADPAIIPGKPLLEGENLPDFWCREDGNELYAFVANPICSEVAYPMEYGMAFKDKGCSREVTVNHHGRSDTVKLDFAPMESLILKITPRGVKVIRPGYIPPKLKGLE